MHAQRSYKADVTCGIVLACGQGPPRFSLALARVTNVSCRLQPGTTLLVTLATAEERHERVTLNGERYLRGFLPKTSEVYLRTNSTPVCETVDVDGVIDLLSKFLATGCDPIGSHAQILTRW